MALNEYSTFVNDKKVNSMSRVTCLIMTKINSKSKVAVMTRNRKWSQDSLSPALAVDKRGENINL